MATKEKINLLEVIPCRNEHIKAEREGETIVLSFPRFKRSWMGQRTVREIIEKLADHFQREAGYESRISTYLTQLQKDGFIKWIMNN